MLDAKQWVAINKASLTKEEETVLRKSCPRTQTKRLHFLSKEFTLDYFNVIVNKFITWRATCGLQVTDEEVKGTTKELI
jgi:hypothetical protein